MMTDGDMTFDLEITDWEVVFTGVKHSWDMVAKYPNNCETFFLFCFFFQHSFPEKSRLQLTA